MLVAFELTDDPRYLSEARNAIDAADGMRFELKYQANLTAWGAAACMRLSRITNRERYSLQSYVYLASFFHNCVLWTSRISLPSQRLSAMPMVYRNRHSAVRRSAHIITTGACCSGIYRRCPTRRRVRSLPQRRQARGRAGAVGTGCDRGDNRPR